MRSTQQNKLLVIITLTYVLISTLHFSTFTTNSSNVLIFGLRGSDDSSMRIRLENDLVFSVLVEGYGYGKFVGNLLYLDAYGKSYLVSIDSQGNLIWAKKIDDPLMYKSRGLSIHENTLLYAYSTIDEMDKGKIVIIKLSESGNLLKSVSVDTDMTLYYGQKIPWIINDLIIDDGGNIYIAGGWHLTAQPYPYNISPSIFIFDKELTRGVRFTINGRENFYVSGMFYSIDRDASTLYACGSIIDVYERGSRGDFTLSSV